MKIVLVNKFYYRRGGDCIFTMNLEHLLKSNGHEVAIFAMDYPENQPSEWRKYWPKNMSKLAALTRPFGDCEVIRKFSKLLDDFAPDVIHLNNIHTQLSPVVAEIAHERGIRVVWTLHDTKLVCPCYTCMRNGLWCTECFSDKTAVIKHRCMPGSVPGAIIGWLEIVKWNRDRLEKCTDMFLPPSQFMKDTVVAGGYSSEKFKVLCNFIDVEKVKNPSFSKGDYYVYLGRVNAVKGVRTLCKVASQLPYNLVVIGDGELLDELKETYRDNIEFLGQKNWDEFRPIIEGARFMVLPAEWSENNPLTIIESQSLGTPVLGSRIGGIPELIEENVNGMTFTSGDVEDLKEKIQNMWNATFDYDAIAKNAVDKYSSKTYYEKLIDIYNGK
ncbi:MAG: glycosyltransferase [Bacteroidales bacterium]|nr:glycosyltransferase [Bacteroidales bacterium]